MVDVLKQNCGDAKTPPPIDMQKLFFAYTMDSISKIFFGRDTNTMCNEKDELAESFDNAHRFLMQFFLGNIAVNFLSACIYCQQDCVRTNIYDIAAASQIIMLTMWCFNTRVAVRVEL